MQQSSGFSLTRNVLLAALLVISLALAAVYGNEGADGPLHSAQSGIMGATGQVASVGAGVGAATETAGGALSDATANPTTLSGLREQNEELRQLLAEAEEYRQEVDRLRGLLDMKQVSGVTGVVAHVVGRSTNAWDQSITIDMGTAEGVVSGMTVMGSTGVLGQVSRAAEHTSTVRLLTDPDSGAAVMVQSSRANGIVRGSLNGLLYLEDVAEDQLPAVGDVIVTSGLGGSYERGLIVGSVVSVGDATTGVGDIIINPNDSAEMLEEVIVVQKAPNALPSAAPANGASSAASASDASAQTGQDDSQVTLDGQVTSTDVAAVEQQRDESWRYEQPAAEDEVAEEGLEEAYDEGYVEEPVEG